MKIARISWAAMVGFAIALSASAASAQAANSGPQTITLNANLGESLTVSLSAPSVSFTLKAGNPSNPSTGGVTATTAWTLASGRSAVNIYAYFASATAALTDTAGDNIPSSAFSIADNSGGYAALINSVPFAAGASGVTLANVAITNANRSGSHSDAMTFNIDLSGTGLGQLPANTYTGTLNIQAQAL